MQRPDKSPLFPSSAKWTNREKNVSKCRARPYLKYRSIHQKLKQLWCRLRGSSRKIQQNHFWGRSGVKTWISLLFQFLLWRAHESTATTQSYHLLLSPHRKTQSNMDYNNTQLITIWSVTYHSVTDYISPWREESGLSDTALTLWHQAKHRVTQPAQPAWPWRHAWPLHTLRCVTTHTPASEEGSQWEVRVNSCQVLPNIHKYLCYNINIYIYTRFWVLPNKMLSFWKISVLTSSTMQRWALKEELPGHTS